MSRSDQIAKLLSRTAAQKGDVIVLLNYWTLEHNICDMIVWHYLCVIRHGSAKNFEH